MFKHTCRKQSILVSTIKLDMPYYYNLKLETHQFNDF